MTTTASHTSLVGPFNREKLNPDLNHSHRSSDEAREKGKQYFAAVDVTMAAVMELDTILNKEEPPSRCDRRMFLGNILNEEPVEQRRRPLPSQPPQPSQTAANHPRPAIQSRSHRIEPRRGGNWATREIDSIQIDRIPVQQLPTPLSTLLIQNLQVWEGVSTGARVAKKRGAFGEEQRRATENTRRNKACFRCRNQQIRCVADSDDPRDWCKPCKGVFFGKNKKTIHKLPCLRVKITASVIFRTCLRGGTIPPPKRWELSPKPSGKGGKQTVEITFGLCEEPIVLRMSQPRPYESSYPDKNPDGDVSQKMPSFSPAYHIADTEWLGPYIDRHAFKQRTLDLALLDSHPLIQETYRQALLHYQSLNSSPPANKRKHQTLMKGLFRLWFGMRHLVGPSCICGEGASGIETGATASERTLTPAHITAQFEVNLFHALTPLRAEVLQNLEAMLVRNRSEDWYTIYLAVFILLHEVSVATKDQNNGDTANSSQTRYSSPDFVLNLHEGANTLILHWHYWVRNVNPLEIKNRHGSSLSGLTDDEFKFVKSSYETMRVIPSEMEKLPVQGAWEHELFWISQIFGPWKRFVGLAAPLMERRKSDGSLPETAKPAGSPSSSSSSTATLTP